MEFIIPIAFAASGSIVVGIALRVIFRDFDPSTISQYRKCAGGWWEAELNDCQSGLLLVPQQPVNTYTNIAYLSCGLFLAFYLGTLPAYVFSLASLYLCVGSALYHGTSTRWAGSLDVSSIYALFGAITVYAGATHVPWKDAPVALIMFAAGVLFAFFLRYRFKGSMTLKIGIFLGVTYLSLLLKNDWSLRSPYLVGSFILFGVAYLIWNLDKWRVFPFKRWGHGLWHIFTAIAASMLFYEVHLLR